MRFDKVLVAAAALVVCTQATSAGDAVHGKQLFTKTCAYCHGMKGTGGPVGPTLQNILDRPSATIAGFPYSDALKASGLVWSRENLSEFLTKPTAKITGTRMMFPGFSNPTDVADVIEYIKEIK